MEEVHIQCFKLRNRHCKIQLLGSRILTHQS
jgi:hypothetical protein